MNQNESTKFVLCWSFYRFYGDWNIFFWINAEILAYISIEWIMLEQVGVVLLSLGFILVHVIELIWQFGSRHLEQKCADRLIEVPSIFAGRIFERSTMENDMFASICVVHSSHLLFIESKYWNISNYGINFMI